jgi:hypothetical protein
MKDNQIGEAYSTQGRDEEYIQACCRKSKGEETRWKTWLYVYRRIILK